MESAEPMLLTTEDYPSVSQKVREIQCSMPDGIGIIPENFGSVKSVQEFLFGSEAATLRKLFRSSDFPLGEFAPVSARTAVIHNKHFEWAPLIFISAALISENPNAVSVALGIISNYATEFFRGLPTKKVKLRIVVERKKDRSCKLLNYEGDAEGLKSLGKHIQRICDE